MFRFSLYNQRKNKNRLLIENEIVSVDGIYFELQPNDLECILLDMNSPNLPVM